MYRILLFLMILLSAATVEAQTFLVQGKIINTKYEPLPFVSIRVKETGSGLITKQDGSFRLSLVAGNYHLQVTMIGYKSQEVPIVVEGNMVKDITLEDESQNLSEVVVKARVRDRAEEIMKQVIRKKRQYSGRSRQLFLQSLYQSSSGNFRLKRKGKRTE